MEPAAIATLAVGAIVRYMASKAAGLAGRAVDEAVDERLDRLYVLVRERFTGHRRQRTLEDLEGKPDDARRQGRLELALEEAIEADPDFAGRLASIIKDLAQRPPAAGVAIHDAGPVAGGDITINAGRDAAGRDLRPEGRAHR